MRRAVCAALALCLVLSGCGAAEEGPQARAEREFSDVVEKAAAAIERVRRDELSHVTQPFEPRDAYDTSDIDISEAELEYLEAVGDYIVESMPEGLSAYDKYRYLGYVLSLCAEYDYYVHEDRLNETPWGALMEGRAICLGYTNTMLWLCE